MATNERTAQVLRRTEQILKRGWTEGSWIKGSNTEANRRLHKIESEVYVRGEEVYDSGIGGEDPTARIVAFEAGKQRLAGPNEQQPFKCCIEGAVCYAAGELGLSEAETGAVIDDLLNPLATEMFAGEVKRGQAAMGESVRATAERFVKRGHWTQDQADEYVRASKRWSEDEPLHALEINDAHKTSAPVLRIVREAINRLENEPEREES